MFIETALLKVVRAEASLEVSVERNLLGPQVILVCNPMD